MHDVRLTNRQESVTADAPSVGDRRIIWWSYCSCGWEGPRRFDHDEADAYGLAHYRDVVGGFQRVRMETVPSSDHLSGLDPVEKRSVLDQLWLRTVLLEQRRQVSTAERPAFDAAGDRLLSRLEAA